MSADRRNLAASLLLSVLLHGMLLSSLDRVARPVASGGIEGRLAAGASGLQVVARENVIGPAVEAAPDRVEPLAKEVPSNHRRVPAKAKEPAVSKPDSGPAESAPAAAETPAVDVSPAPALSRAAYYAGINAYYAGLSQTMARLRQRADFSPPSRTGGRTSVRVFVGAGGVPQRLELLGSSGEDILDDTALLLLRLAVGHTRVPEGMQGIDFSIDLAINFPATVPPAGE